MGKKIKIFKMFDQKVLKGLLLPPLPPSFVLLYSIVSETVEKFVYFVARYIR